MAWDAMASYPALLCLREPQARCPAYNILLIGAFAFAGCLLLNYERAAELINFGAFLAFMGSTRA